jgi:hypothetical protein
MLNFPVTVEAHWHAAEHFHNQRLTSFPPSHQVVCNVRAHVMVDLVDYKQQKLGF